MSADWISRIPLVVNTRIKSEFSEVIKNKYNMTNVDNFSTKDSSATPPVFPFIYINILPGAEVGQDLEGTEINGGIFAFQIVVYDNISESRAREVMSEVIRIMKSMHFLCNQFPVPSTSSGVHRSTARFKRTIGANDIL